MAGAGSQLQDWKQEGTRWVKLGQQAPLEADAYKLLAHIFGGHCLVLGGHSAHAILAACTDPFASLRAHWKQNGYLICNLQAREG